MKALTVYQPWASLIVAGIKRIETRPMRTGQRDTLAIHAAKASPLQTMAGMPYIDRERVLAIVDNELLVPAEDLPRGCLLGTVTVIDCLPAEIVGKVYNVGRAEHQLGDYTEGRYAWVLRDPRQLGWVIPCRGYQGLWNTSRELEEVLRGLTA